MIHSIAIVLNVSCLIFLTKSNRLISLLIEFQHILSSKLSFIMLSCKCVFQTTLFELFFVRSQQKVEGWTHHPIESPDTFPFLHTTPIPFLCSIAISIALALEECISFVWTVRRYIRFRIPLLFRGFPLQLIHKGTVYPCFSSISSKRRQDQMLPCPLLRCSSYYVTNTFPLHEEGSAHQNTSIFGYFNCDSRLKCSPMCMVNARIILKCFYANVAKCFGPLEKWLIDSDNDWYYMKVVYGAAGQPFPYESSTKLYRSIACRSAIRLGSRSGSPTTSPSRCMMIPTQTFAYSCVHSWVSLL